MQKNISPSQSSPEKQSPFTNFGQDSQRLLVEETGPEPDTPHGISNTMEYLRPSHDELSLAWELVSEAQQTPVVRECRKRMVEEDDPELLEHSYRVAIAGTILGMRSGFSREELFVTAVAAECHDVGRLDPSIRAVVDAPIRYEGAERDSAMKIINRHAELGAAIVRTYASENQDLEGIAAIVEGHQSFSNDEPYGPRPKMLVKVARMVAFADELDALASKRDYKTVFDEAKTRRILSEQFDGGPELLALF